MGIKPLGTQIYIMYQELLAQTILDIFKDVTLNIMFVKGCGTKIYQDIFVGLFHNMQTLIEHSPTQQYLLTICSVSDCVRSLTV